MSVKRRDLIRYLEEHGFHLLREGGNHSIYSYDQTVIPVKRHRQLDRWTKSGHPVAPGVANVVPSGNTVTLELDGVIPDGAWTTFTYVWTGDHVSLGYLPADANNDRVSDSVDIQHLIDCLNGVATACEIWQTDVDRSGQAGATDILRLIDLLNGAGAYDVYLGATLPPAPCRDLGIVSSDPPDDSIDARQPFEIDGSNPDGWNSIEITFDKPAAGVTADHFAVTVSGGVAPGIVNVTPDGHSVTLELDDFIPFADGQTKEGKALSVLVRSPSIAARRPLSASQPHWLHCSRRRWTARLKSPPARALTATA